MFYNHHLLDFGSTVVRATVKRIKRGRFQHQSYAGVVLNGATLLVET